jgi:hypothetical protein
MSEDAAGVGRRGRADAVQGRHRAGRAGPAVGPSLWDGDLAVAEPKALYYRMWHAGRIVTPAGIVRIDRAWPGAADLVTAYGCYGPCRCDRE